VVDLIVLACLVFAIVSRRLEGTVLTAPMIFVLAGAVLGPAGLGLVEMGLENHTVLLLGEITLALVLFTDAARTGFSALRKNRALPLSPLEIWICLPSRWGP
jgi:NhaP-type Na+/H+ or K+/H+ antiporter